jgi:ribonuclease G
LAEWLIEQGIGETRAILVGEGEIVEAAIELPGTLPVGVVLDARLVSILVPRARGIAALADGSELLIEPLPPRLTEGEAIRVEIIREPIAEAGRAKLAKGRVSDLQPREGATLRQRLAASGDRVRETSLYGGDDFEEAGWSELLEQAATGALPFSGGALRMSLTPAMTLFDVDGALPPAALAVAGAEAAGRAIRRFAIGGSIGIDLPTLGSRDQRQAAAAALDAVLPQPFERTAVNGFGFLQVVRKRERASVAELVQGDPVGAAARALLRRAERAGGSGTRTLTAAPAVITRIERNPEWVALLARRCGVAVALRSDPALALGAGHVQSEFA